MMTMSATMNSAIVTADEPMPMSNPCVDMVEVERGAKRRMRASGLRSAMTQRRAAHADDVHRVAARHVGRGELGVPLRAAVGDARACRPDSTPARAPSGRCRATAPARRRAVRRRQRCASDDAGHRDDAGDDELHREARRRAARRARRWRTRRRPPAGRTSRSRARRRPAPPRTIHQIQYAAILTPSPLRVPREA